MKRLLGKYKQKPYLLVLSISLWMIFLLGGGLSIPAGVDALRAHEYRTAPITDFYEVCSLTADNAVVGDSYHTLYLRANNNVSDWNADINRELVRIGSPTNGKLLFQDGFDAILEQRNCSMTVEVDYPLPANITSGTYFWRIQANFELPYGVRRKATITTTPFNITEKPYIISTG